MRTSVRFNEYVRSTFQATDATRLLQVIEALDDRFGGQDPERLSLAIAILMDRGVELDAVIELARRDWRDLLVASGLGRENWPEVVSKHLGP